MCRECDQYLDEINEAKLFTRTFLARRDLYIIGEGEVSIRVLENRGKIYAVFGKGEMPDDNIQFPSFYNIESAKNLMCRISSDSA